uniref:Uncharacterized protein n=1 Tax=Romanomermis culicivorax TaxID=13658 RepID=A0A915IF98_ROMCU
MNVTSEDVLDEKTTDGQGNFFVSGQTSEVTDIDPVLKIYHNCLDNALTIRKRRWRFEMPKKHINKATVDVGVLNLEVKPLEEDRNL